MTLMERLRAASRYLGLFAEAMDYDPVDDLRRHIERLEQLSGGDPQRSGPTRTES